MKVSRAKFTKVYIDRHTSAWRYDGTSLLEKEPDADSYNVNAFSDPCEAVIALAIGQSVSPSGELRVRHFRESADGVVEVVHVTSDCGTEELRRKLYSMVDTFITRYHDQVNGA